jgi:rhodanese-related sulfurtransferase
MRMAVSIPVSQLIELLPRPAPPLVLDVRRAHVFAAAPSQLTGAAWRDPSAVGCWSGELDRERAVVVYCAHGQAVSQGAADALSAAGLDARYLEGGIAAWIAAGGPVERKSVHGVTWITRERPKIDRVACPWLITRFIDAAPTFVFVPAAAVFDEAERLGAIPYDIPGAELSHRGELCSFDAFLADYRLDDPALRHLATIVRGADTARLDLAPQAAGLLAVSLGLSANFADDHDMLAHGLVLYDALYEWCRSCTQETHGWPPAPPAGPATRIALAPHPG